MTAVHLHLLVNHVPIVGTLFCLLLLVLAWFRRSDELARAALLGLVLVGLLTVPTYFSGGQAEDTAEKLPEVTHEVIEEHEESALFAFIVAGVLGALALSGLVAFRGGRPLPRWMTMLALVATLFSFAVMARTGNLGGQVRHTEIRGG